jgi:diketogulonate reductase-like aldo/keto reductase
VLLRWEVQQELVVNSSTQNKQHMAENLDIFDFTLSTQFSFLFSIYFLIFFIFYLPFQVLLRWEIQQGLVVNPRTQNKQHMAENLDIFDFILSPSEMQEIQNVPKPPPGENKVCADPHLIP